MRDEEEPKLACLWSFCSFIPHPSALIPSFAGGADMNALAFVVIFLLSS
jgi:hypothetical protein